MEQKPNDCHATMKRSKTNQFGRITRETL